MVTAAGGPEYALSGSFGGVDQGIGLMQVLCDGKRGSIRMDHPGPGRHLVFRQGMTGALPPQGRLPLPDRQAGSGLSTRTVT